MNLRIDGASDPVSLIISNWKSRAREGRSVDPMPTGHLFFFWRQLFGEYGMRPQTDTDERSLRGNLFHGYSTSSTRITFSPNPLHGLIQLEIMESSARLTEHLAGLTIELNKQSWKLYTTFRNSIVFIFTNKEIYSSNFYRIFKLYISPPRLDWIQCIYIYVCVATEKEY